MATYEAQSWQLPARPTAWEQPAPSAKAGMLGYQSIGKRRTDEQSRHDSSFPARGSSSLWHASGRYVGIFLDQSVPINPDDSPGATNVDVCNVAETSSGRVGWLTFSPRFLEVDRALDNLHKSGKFFNNMPSRRESIPMMGVPRPYAEFGRFPPYAIGGDWA